MHKYAADKPPMKSRRLFLCFVLIAVHGLGHVPAVEVRIIANSSVEATEVSREELSRIFLMTKTSLAGAGHVEPVLEREGVIHDLFLRMYIGRTGTALMTYYRGLVFSGKASIPKTFANDQEVVKYVAKTKGSIGYVSSSTEILGVKTLKVK